jgi:hypothetical protein
MSVSTSRAAMWLAPISLVAMLVLTFGADAVVRWQGGLTLGAAIALALTESPVSLIALLLFLLPVAAAHMFAAHLSHLRSLAHGAVLLGAVYLGSLVLSVSGYSGYYSALTSKRWTAASLSIGTLPLQQLALVLLISIPVVYVCRKKAKRD